MTQLSSLVQQLLENVYFGMTQSGALLAMRFFTSLVLALVSES